MTSGAGRQVDGRSDGEVRFLLCSSGVTRGLSASENTSRPLFVDHNHSLEHDLTVHAVTRRDPSRRGPVARVLHVGTVLVGAAVLLRNGKTRPSISPADYGTPTAKSTDPHTPLDSECLASFYCKLKKSLSIIDPCKV